jgi:hypothetical protein
MDATNAQPAELDPMLNLLRGKSQRGAPLSPLPGAAIGVLVGMEAGCRPLVLLAEETVARIARSVVDLRRSHIGHEVALVFEDDGRERPIVVGVMRDGEGWSTLPDTSGQVEVDVDGHRMIVSARQELVLRCGAASITLDHEGRITIRGTHVVSHSEGVNRIRGGAVQLN